MRNAVTFLLLLLVLLSPFSALADQSSDIQTSIDQKNAQIQTLQQQVSQYQDQVDQIQAQADTLKGALKVISTNQKELNKNLGLTTTKSQKTQLVMQMNQEQIGDLGVGISKNTQAIAQTLRLINQNDNGSFLELLASQTTVSGFLEDVDQVLNLQSSLEGDVSTMRIAKQNLINAQSSLADQKVQLKSLVEQLSDQKKIVDDQANQQQALLDQTKGQESNYQQMLDATQKEVDGLTTELYSYESQLKFTLNPNTLPAAGSAPLAWPLASVLITQKFGKTVDSKRLYAVGTHSGVDFRAAIGTPVYAVADGTVEGTGNTDLTCPKASFGKWVFIRHNNGLATAYGHLSLIKATQGETVKEGELIGYSGDTGHVTAPHLHLTVFAANGIDGQEGARVDSMPSQACKGKTYTMPIAPTNAYLDPLLYLPHATKSMYKDGEESSSE